MKPRQLFLPVLLSATLLSGKSDDGKWRAEKHKGYNLWYTSIDNGNKTAYRQLVETGLVSVRTFISSGYNKEFDVYIHPNRRTLDSTWQKDWKMPDFKSECWMVASGVATKLDVISPKEWDKEACEHRYEEAEKTQKLITHELVHVYHGQLNASPDFSNVEGIDWFVEGLATYASGQCDTPRILEVKNAIVADNVPKSTDGFWNGKLKYGLSGSLVMYIDKKYGRSKLKELLPLTKNSEIMKALNASDAELLSGWKDYIQKQ